MCSLHILCELFLARAALLCVIGAMGIAQASRYVGGHDETMVVFDGFCMKRVYNSPPQACSMECFISRVNMAVADLGEKLVKDTKYTDYGEIWVTNRAGRELTVKFQLPWETTLTTLSSESCDVFQFTYFEAIPGRWIILRKQDDEKRHIPAEPFLRLVCGIRGRIPKEVLENIACLKKEWEWLPKIEKSLEQMALKSRRPLPSTLDGRPDFRAFSRRDFIEFVDDNLGGSIFREPLTIPYKKCLYCSRDLLPPDEPQETKAPREHRSPFAKVTTNSSHPLKRWPQWARNAYIKQLLRASDPVDLDAIRSGQLTIDALANKHYRERLEALCAEEETLSTPQSHEETPKAVESDVENDCARSQKADLRKKVPATQSVPVAATMDPQSYKESPKEPLKEDTTNIKSEVQKLNDYARAQKAALRKKVPTPALVRSVTQSVPVATTTDPSDKMNKRARKRAKQAERAKEKAVLKAKDQLIVTKAEQIKNYRPAVEGELPRGDAHVLTKAMKLRSRDKARGRHVVNAVLEAAAPEKVKMMVKHLRLSIAVASSSSS